MNRWNAVAYLAVVLTSTALATVQPTVLPEAAAVTMFDDAASSAVTSPMGAATAPGALTPASSILDQLLDGALPTDPLALLDSTNRPSAAVRPVR